MSASVYIDSLGIHLITLKVAEDINPGRMWMECGCCDEPQLYDLFDIDFLEFIKDYVYLGEL